MREWVPARQRWWVSRVVLLAHLVLSRAAVWVRLYLSLMRLLQESRKAARWLAVVRGSRERQRVAPAVRTPQESLARALSAVPIETRGG